MNQPDKELESTADDTDIIQLLQAFDPQIPSEFGAHHFARPWLNKGDVPMQTHVARWHSRPAIIAITLLVVLAVVGAGYGILAPGRVSAAEIIANTRQRQDAKADFGLHSYRGTLTATQPATPSMNGQVAIQGRNRWAKFCPPATDDCLTFIETPTYSWTYDAATKQAQRLDFNSAKPQNFLESDLFSGNSLDQVIASASINANVELSGTEMIAGRPTYVLLIHPPHGRPATWRVSVDQEYFIGLRVAVLGSDGTEESVMTYTSLEINPTIDSAVFDFVPPTDATVTCRQSATTYVSEQVVINGQTVNQDSALRPIDPATGDVVVEDPIVLCPGRDQ